MSTEPDSQSTNCCDKQELQELQAPCDTLDVLTELCPTGLTSSFDEIAEAP